jgi:tetratricopeptide (TPR) repeat protein
MKVVNFFCKLFLVVAFLSLGIQARACLWDRSTPGEERRRHPDLAKAVYGEQAKAAEPGPLRERIKSLLANRHEDDPAWLNDLAGAHIRLGELKEAVQLLEPGVLKFPNDYGVHANLGTAYHLQGRYGEAEREIARDLEINPEAHFGLEKYHLALLQYLIRDPGYRARHVYVDEFTMPFLQSNTHMLGVAFSMPPFADQPLSAEDKSELTQLEKNYLELVRTGTNGVELSNALVSMSFFDAPAPYTTKWDLSKDPKLLEGVIYMATLNPKEPACFQMLGILCLKKADRNMAAAAYEKAIALGSPQAAFLGARLKGLRAYNAESRARWLGRWMVASLLMLILLSVAYFIISQIRKS